MTPRRENAGPATSPAPSDSNRDDSDEMEPTAWLRQAKETYAAVPKSVMECRCSVCVHAFAVLDHPKHREADKALSMNKLAELMGVQWRDVNWHLREHLRGWVDIVEPARPGAATKVRLVHNPASCRELFSRTARPLAASTRAKRQPRPAPNLGTPAEEPLHPGRGDLCTPAEEALHPGRALSVPALSDDLQQSSGQPAARRSEPLTPPPPMPGRQRPDRRPGGEPNRSIDGQGVALRPIQAGPMADEPDGEERATNGSDSLHHAELETTR